MALLAKRTIAVPSYYLHIANVQITRSKVNGQLIEYIKHKKSQKFKPQAFAVGCIC
jgi:hypothetical protein